MSVSRQDNRNPAAAIHALKLLRRGLYFQIPDGPSSHSLLIFFSKLLNDYQPSWRQGPSRSTDQPTMKPVDLISYPILNSSRNGDVVLNTFGVSGSTLIACAKQGRIFL